MSKKPWHSRNSNSYSDEENLNARIKQETYDRLLRHVGKNKVTKKAVVEKALNEYFERCE